MPECDLGIKRLDVSKVPGWSVGDVEIWLRASGYETYVEFFCDRHKIDGRALLLMRERDLRQPPLSINCLGDIKRLTYGLKRLRRRYLKDRAEIATSKLPETQHTEVGATKDASNVTIDLDNSPNETIVLDTDSLEISLKNRGLAPPLNPLINVRASTQRTDPSNVAIYNNATSGLTNDISKDLFPTLSNSPSQLAPTKPTAKAVSLESLLSSDSSVDLSDGQSNEIPLAPRVISSIMGWPKAINAQHNNRLVGGQALYPSLSLAGSGLPIQNNLARHRGNVSSRKHHQASNKSTLPNGGQNYGSATGRGWADDPAVVLKAILALAYTLVAFLTTAFVMVVVDDRVPDITRYPPLPDIFLDNIPLIPGAFVICEQIAIVLGIMFGCVCLLHKYRFIILRRFCALTGTVFFLRCITMVITSLSVPGSHLNCHNGQGITPISVKVIRALRIWSGFGMSLVGIHTCGDYMFSGHTVILTMLNFFITEYTPRSFYLLHTFSWVLNLFGIFFILAAHEHYSIDVFIAFYITTRLFLYYHSLANNRALKQSDRDRMRTWFPMFSFFESHIEGIVPNVYGLPLALLNLCSNIALLKPFLPSPTRHNPSSSRFKGTMNGGARSRNNFSDGERSGSCC